MICRYKQWHNFGICTVIRSGWLDLQKFLSITDLVTSWLSQAILRADDVQSHEHWSITPKYKFKGCPPIIRTESQNAADDKTNAMEMQSKPTCHIRTGKQNPYAQIQWHDMLATTLRSLRLSFSPTCPILSVIVLFLLRWDRPDETRTYSFSSASIRTDVLRY